MCGKPIQPQPCPPREETPRRLLLGTKSSSSSSSSLRCSQGEVSAGQHRSANTTRCRWGGEVQEGAAATDEYRTRCAAVCCLLHACGCVGWALLATADARAPRRNPPTKAANKMARRSVHGGGVHGGEHSNAPPSGIRPEKNGATHITAVDAGSGEVGAAVQQDEEPPSNTQRIVCVCVCSVLLWGCCWRTPARLLSVLLHPAQHRLPLRPLDPHLRRLRLPLSMASSSEIVRLQSRQQNRNTTHLVVERGRPAASRAETMPGKLKVGVSAADAAGAYERPGVGAARRRLHATAHSRLQHKLAAWQLATPHHSPPAPLARCPRPRSSATSIAATTAHMLL